MNHLMKAVRLAGFGLLLPMMVLNSTAILAGQTVTDEAPTTGIKRYQVDYGGITIDTYDQGKGPLVVLLPSLGRGQEDFGDIAQRLSSSGYRVLRPEPRGVALSRGPMYGITLHELARDVDQVIRHANAGPAFLVGHAYGNWIARVIATDYPEDVRAITFLAAAPKGAIEPLLRKAITDSSDLSLPTAQRLKALNTAFFSSHAHADEWLSGWNPDTMRMQRTAAAATPQASWWGAGATPLMDIQAGDDALLPPSRRSELAKEFGSRVTTTIIPNAGHALVPEQPEAVANALIKYFHQHSELTSAFKPLSKTGN